MMNRETWLNEIATLMAPRFAELGHPLPPFRVAIGWPSGGKDSDALGECWNKSVSASGHFEIFVSPGQAGDLQVAMILAHELVHAAVGLNHGHKGDFAKVAIALGFARPLTHASAILPEQLTAWLQPLIDAVGALPHAAINYRRDSGPRVKRGAGGVDLEPQEGEAGEPTNSRKPKQSTRMLKAACTAQNDEGETCGYTVRLSKKWAQELGACCPVHGALEVEGADA